MLGQVRRGGEDAADARAKLEAMNRYFDSIPGYSGAKIDIDGASFSDKPVNRELRRVTGYTGLFGPDAKEGEKFGDYVKSLRDNKDFYFVHSFCFEASKSENIIATTFYGNDFTSIINKDNIYGFQFHPEKSQRAGQLILKNFIKLK